MRRAADQSAARMSRGPRVDGRFRGSSAPVGRVPLSDGLPRPHSPPPVAFRTADLATDSASADYGFPGRRSSFGPVINGFGGAVRVEVDEPEALQHVPVSGMRGDALGEGVGEALAQLCDLLLLAALGGHLDSGQTLAYCTPSPYQRVTGHSAAPVARASAAGPAGILVVSPKNSTGTPLSVRSRSATRHTIPPDLSRRSRPPKVPAAAGEREHFHADGLAVAQPALEELLRLEPLGDGGEAVADGRGPGTRMVPVPHVRKRQDDAAARGERVPQHLLVLDDERVSARARATRSPAGTCRSSSACSCASPAWTRHGSAPRWRRARARARGWPRAAARSCRACARHGPRPTGTACRPSAPAGGARRPTRSRRRGRPVPLSGRSRRLPHRVRVVVQSRFPIEVAHRVSWSFAAGADSGASAAVGMFGSGRPPCPAAARASACFRTNSIR